jgi:phosphoglycerate dehydrogenase-like enzyme
MSRPRVLVLSGPALFRSFFDVARVRRLDSRYAWTLLPGRKLTRRLRALLAEAEALVTTWDSPRFGAELPRLAPRLRVVAHCGGEVKGRFARELFSRLTIANAPGPMSPYVAELAVTFLLMAVRRVDEHRASLRRRSNAVYARLHTHGAGRETLRGATVGILGLGRIGRDTARLLVAFGPRLVGYDPYVKPHVARSLGVETVSISRLLAESDAVVVAAALTPETRGLLDRKALRRLRDGALVVNVARGGIVDLAALTREVRSGRLRCALDVTDPVEPLPSRHPLRRMRGAVLTPHVGAAQSQVRHAMADVVLDALERFFAGRRLPTRVTPAMLERMT